MPGDTTFEDKWREFEAAVSSAPSVADDVMRRIEEKPSPVRRRLWTSGPAMAACAAGILGVAGAIVASWTVARGRDADTVALHSANSSNRQLPRPMNDVIPLEQTQEGSGPQDFNGAPSVPSPAGGVEQDRGRPEDVVGTERGSARGEARLAPSPNVYGREQVTRVPMPNTGPAHHNYGEPFGRPADGLAGGPDGRPDGLNDDDGLGATGTRLPKSMAIRLAAKCIREAEPNTRLKLDARSATARYCHNSKAYNGKSLWLVGFPETDRNGPESDDAAGIKTILYRMVWVQEDGSYSGNCQGELPPADPPVLLGPDDEARAIQLAKAFLVRHHPEPVGNRPATATFNGDSLGAGGGALWIIGFVNEEDRRTGPQGINGPPPVHAVWVTLDGAVMLGPLVGLGTIRAEG